ncbi:LOW QUALITY PROTEIN: hypothetical protein IFM46972_11579, partial [Aspergillus udagawae]
ICTAHQCQYAVSLQTLLTHLRIHYCSYLTVATPALREAVLTEILKRPWIDPTKRPCVILSLGDPPVSGLLVYQGHGYPYYSYVACTTETMQKHCWETYKDLEPPYSCGRHSGRQRLAAVLLLMLSPASASSLYGSWFFEVTCAAIPPSKQALQASVLITAAERIRACMD